MNNTKGEGMKTSNKILLSAGIVPFIIILFMLLSLKNILDEGPAVRNIDDNKMEYIHKRFDLEGFENIKAEGGWEIAITGGDHFNIELEAPGDSIDKISVSRQGNILLLSSDTNYFSILKNPKVSITLPSLSMLDLKGQYDIKISNLKLSELDINIEGVASITGIGGSVERFFFNGNGVVTADLISMPATNAYFKFDGIYMIMMGMNGGELSGILSGPGKLMTTGDITKNSIKVDNPNFIAHN